MFELLVDAIMDDLSLDYSYRRGVNKTQYLRKGWTTLPLSYLT